MSTASLVSIIIPFYNTPMPFMEEAVASVLAQTYRHWELLLIDDGSTGESTDLARRYAEKYSGQIRYVEHPGHENRGLSCSRTLGITLASGVYTAFLDADDVWMPEKLEQQVTLLGAHPDVSMIYGNTQYWYSWTGDPKDCRRDFMPRLGVAARTVVRPPTMLSLFLRGEAAVPCPSSILVRREVFEDIGGFEDAFGIFNVQQLNMYEDQVFYAKVCLTAPVFVADACWHRYRQHPDSICAVAEEEGQADMARFMYLRWLERYLLSRQIDDRLVWKALREELQCYDHHAWSGHIALARYVRRRVRKLLRRL